jgi:RimJ/RimL family protein N-acetyltransferase
MVKTPMTVFLETKRLILKKTEQSDFNNLLALRSDPDVMKYTEQGVQTKEDVQKFLDITVPFQKKYGYDICSVFEKNSDDFIGQAGLFCAEIENEQSEVEIGFSLHKKYWGQGYGTELVKALIQWGFDHLSVRKLVAYIDPKNTASHRVLQKCGMMDVGINGNLLKFEIYKDDSIELVPYRPEWSNLAQQEIKILGDALPVQHILEIQHIGSTAIPGIHSKPIIDIQIAVDSLIAIKPIAITALKSLGYEFWADNPDTERMFFVKGMPPFGEKRTHHVHIVEPVSRHWQGKIQFRDYLLSYTEAAREYEKLKIQ